MFKIISDFTDLLSVKWSLILTLIFIITYQTVLKNWYYFSKQNVKFDRGIPLLGSDASMYFGKGSSLKKLYNKFPKERFFGFYDLFGKPVYMIRHPELIQQISISDFDHFSNRRFAIKEESDQFMARSLFNAKDQKWKDLRSLISPAFTGSKLKSMIGLVVDVLQERFTNLREESRNGTITRDLQEVFRRIVGDTIGSSAFGVEVNSLKDPDNEFYKKGTSMVNFSGLSGLIFTAYGSAPDVMNKLKIKIMKDNDMEYLKRLILDLIDYREKNNIFRPDVINLLIEAKKSSAQKFDDIDLVAQPLIFFFGGFSTLAVSLGFLAHEMALNKDIQQKLLDEIIEVERELKGQRLTYEAMGKMKYTDMLVLEGLRRWNLAAGANRKVTKPYIIENNDGSKVKLIPGDIVLFASDLISMDPEYFPDPEKFDPERFNNDSKSPIPSNSFIPFGLGPRNCIASRFALMQLKASVYYLVLNFEINKCDRTQHPLKLNPTTPFVEPADGFWLELKDRNLKYEGNNDEFCFNGINGNIKTIDMDNTIKISSMVKSVDQIILHQKIL